MEQLSPDVKRMRMFPIWLDKLPDDVCWRIASCLTLPMRYDCAINLAMTSAKQRRAVKQATEYKIDRQRMSDSTAELVTLLADEVREFAGDFERYEAENVLKALQSASLNRVAILSFSCYLAALKHTSSVRALQMNLLSDLGSAAGNRQEVQWSLRRLCHLNLTELRLISGPQFCANDVLIGEGEQNSCAWLAECFPNVTVLEISCYCATHKDTPWSVIEPFANLKELSVTPGAQYNALALLKQIRKVRLLGVGSFELAPQVGDNVTCVVAPVDGFTLQDRPIQRYELEMLRECSSLEELECSITEGGEQALPTVATSLHKLRTEVWRDVENYSEDSLYHAPEPGLLLRTVKMAPFLKVLHLSQMRIDPVELVAILKQIGCRLEDFKVSVIKQGLPDLEYLTILLEAVARYNPMMRRLEFVYCFCNSNDAPLDSVLRLQAALNVLRRRCLFLDLDFMKTATAFIQERTNFHKEECYGMVS